MSWETARSWDLMRPLVYYLVEDFVPAHLVEGRDVIDFSAGLGDLSRYMLDAGARSLVATIPDVEPPASTAALDWRPGVAAGNLASSFAPDSFDLAVARMVFQFPTWEGDAADPDTLTEEFATILRPGGRLVIAFHEFVAAEPIPGGPRLPDLEALISHLDPGRAALVRYLGLPPREGPSGESGFGLKVPMLVTTLQNRGFDIEYADHPEPFTFPDGVDERSDAEMRQLGEEVFALKRRHLADVGDPYGRPSVIRAMLDELAGMMSFVTWPIVRIVARRR